MSCTLDSVTMIVGHLDHMVPAGAWCIFLTYIYIYHIYYIPGPIICKISDCTLNFTAFNVNFILATAVLEKAMYHTHTHTQI